MFPLFALNINTSCVSIVCFVKWESPKTTRSTRFFIKNTRFLSWSSTQLFNLSQYCWTKINVYISQYCWNLKPTITNINVVHQFLRDIYIAKILHQAFSIQNSCHAGGENHMNNGTLVPRLTIHQLHQWINANWHLWLKLDSV